MNPTQTEQKIDKSTEERSSVTSGSTANWKDRLMVNRTLKIWRRTQKKAARRNRIAAAVETLPYVGIVGDFLYLVGFWVEYLMVCTGRKLKAIARGIGISAGNLLLDILRPFVLGIITFLEDITAPFARIARAVRTLREMGQNSDTRSEQEIKAEKISYLRRGVVRYIPLLWNAVSYLLPVAAVFLFVSVVRGVLGTQYILNVQVNGKSVGFVESEQVFENAREDVQSRINTAKALLAEAGTEVPDTQWDIQPTYTLAISGDTMTESEAADAILRASSDEIGSGTAVYVDGALRFVTNEGDHLRTFLESLKSPYEETMDASMRVTFLHDIHLEDGVYLLESISSYPDIMEEMYSDAEKTIYTASEGETVQSIADSAGLSVADLTAMNPDLTDPNQGLSDGMDVVVDTKTPELLKIKVVQRQSYQQDVPYQTITTESDQYDFGKTVKTQEGVLGLQEVTQDLTYIDGELSSVDVVSIETLREPVPELITKGTKLKNGMIAQVGSGTFLWPVPQFTYVSRWMGYGHNGADICAAYGTPIIASDGGAVVTATYHYSYGNYVVIDHGNGYRTLYAHMSSIAVSAGQGVKQGQIIGYVGSTGYSTGNHCHFEMYRNSVRFSAYELFGGRV